MTLSFSRPELLLLLLVLLPLSIWVWRQHAGGGLRAVSSLITRLVIFSALVLALAGAAAQQPVGRQAVVFVADLSASTQSAQAQQAAFISQAVRAKGPDDAFAVVTTAQGAQVDRVLGSSGSFDQFSSSPPPDATDLAAGLRLAGSLLPSAYRTRVVLLSDGQENSGDARAEARLLRARGAEVDVVPLPASTSPEVLVDSVDAPTLVNQGERFSVRVTLASNISTSATVHVAVGNTPLADQTVSLTPGSTDLSFSAQASSTGFTDVRATVDADHDTNPQNNTARAVVQVQGPPSVLVVEQRPGEGAAIASALSSAGMQVSSQPPDQVPDQAEGLSAWSAVVLADVSADSLNQAQQNALRAYVRDLGRGLLAIGGDTSFGQGGYLGTPLDDLLPVHSSVRTHTDQGRVALVLVIDRSGSMGDDIYHEGTTKLDMARQAAILSAQQLGPRDLIGIEAFDSFQHWIVPMASVLSLGPTAIGDKLAGLTADGGTDIYPALAAGFNAVRDTDAEYKDLILMTDGLSCCGGDYAGLLDQIHAANVTLSTIAIGGDADTQLLSNLAHQGDGRYYFAQYARDIPRLMTRETELATRGPLVEGTVTPRQVAPDATLSALAAGGLPPLSGYLVTTPKDLADVLLVSDAGDPLLARWPYGLGRAVAWTSDLRGRWSDQWLQWSGMPQLFASLVSWAMPPAQGPLQVSVREAAGTGHVTVAENQPGPASDSVVATISQPDGSAVQLPLAASGPGEYEGDFPLTGDGTYIVNAQAHRGAAPGTTDQTQGAAAPVASGQTQPDGAVVASGQAALAVSYPAEFRQVTPDPTRLAQIAAAGGGHALARPADAFADDLAPVSSPLPLAQLLLSLALALLPLDVALRRLRLSWRDIWGWLRHPQPLSLHRPALSALQPPSWLPGAWAPRRPPPAVVAPPLEPRFTATVTPGLARQSSGADSDEDDDDDPLAATTRWLRARRSTHGDSH